MQTLKFIKYVTGDLGLEKVEDPCNRIFIK